MQAQLEVGGQHGDARGRGRQEVVFLLGRTGRDKDALNMILDQMNDIDKALKFVKERKQEELWEMLIDRVVSESDPNSLSKLLDTAGSHIDPILIIERIPAELEGALDHLFIKNGTSPLCAYFSTRM